jgi:hypothetical protein
VHQKDIVRKHAILKTLSCAPAVTALSAGSVACAAGTKPNIVDLSANPHSN